MIMRKGIPYGPEVTPEEAAENKTKVDRGLAFVCYQASIAEGFEFVQTLWANSQSFPPGKSVTEPGFDPIGASTFLFRYPGEGRSKLIRFCF